MEEKLEIKGIIKKIYGRSSDAEGINFSIKRIQKLKIKKVIPCTYVSQGRNLKKIKKSRSCLMDWKEALM